MADHQRPVVRDLSGMVAVAPELRPSSATPAEPAAAHRPDATGFVVRDGVRIAWQRSGDGDPTLLLMPTWSIFPSRHWKFQVPYLARHFRVVTFDGRGSGASDRPADPAAYADTEFVDDAAAVLDATGTDRAVIVGMSMGAGYSVRFAVDRPDRTRAIVLIGSALAVRDRPEGTPDVPDDTRFEEPRDPEEDDGWGRHNAHFWRRDWPGFAEWFVGTRIFSEPHSTKPIEDGVGWALETDPETMIAIRRAPYLRRPADWPVPPSTEGRAIAFLRRVTSTALVIHGTDDRIVPISSARRIAAEVHGRLVEIESGGHAPHLRDPVLVNHLIRRFVDELPGDP
jgi:pimeloyl-ACP methyl ester carboxylesterase